MRQSRLELAPTNVWLHTVSAVAVAAAATLGAHPMPALGQSLAERELGRVESEQWDDQPDGQIESAPALVADSDASEPELGALSGPTSAVPAQPGAALTSDESALAVGALIGALGSAAVLLAVVGLLRWARSRPGVRTAGALIQTIETYQIGRGRAIHILSLGARVLVLSEGRDGISVLCELDGEDLALSGRAVTGSPDGAVGMGGTEGSEVASAGTDSAAVGALRRAISRLGALADEDNAR